MFHYLQDTLARSTLRLNAESAGIAAAVRKRFIIIIIII